VQLISVGSSRGESNFHLIFTPKYRRDVFTDDGVKRMCLESFAETCYVLGVRMEACEFGPDHVHLFVSESVQELLRPVHGPEVQGFLVAQDQEE
jgi:REP element-mobilizing transposase RayT